MWKLLKSPWLYLNVLMSFFMALVFFHFLDDSLEERSLVLFLLACVGYSIAVVLIGGICNCLQENLLNTERRIFHLIALLGVSQLLVISNLYFREDKIIWYPLMLAIFGLSIWGIFSKNLIRSMKRKLCSYVGMILFFIVPMSSVFYLLLVGSINTHLEINERERQSAMRNSELCAKIINLALSKSLLDLSQKKSETLGQFIARAKAQKAVIAVRATDPEQRVVETSGERDVGVSKMLLDIKLNQNEIKKWLMSDNSSCSHAFRIFVFEEYLADINPSEKEGRDSLVLRKQCLEWEMGADQPRYTEIITVNGIQLLMSHSHILGLLGDEVIPVDHRARGFQTLGSGRSISIAEEGAVSEYLVKIIGFDREVFIVASIVRDRNSIPIPTWFYLLVLGWVYLAIFGLLYYSRHRGRIASEKLDIISTVAHEFRTPLTGVSVLVDGLLNDDEVYSEKLQSYLLKMKAANQRLHRVSEHFFIEGKLSHESLKLERVNIAIWLNEQWEIFERCCDFKKKQEVLYLYETEGAIQQKILIDPVLLSVALQNLLKNAYDYTDKGYVRLSVLEKNQWLGFKVVDTGRGIDKCMLKKIFQKYKRAEDSLNRNTEGLGIGLHLAKQIVLLHDGRIELSSELNKGSCFTLWIEK